MNDAFEVSQSGLVLVFLAAWRTLPLFLIAALFSLVFLRRFASKYHVVLWSLVMIRLVLPISVSSPFSLHGPIDQVVAAITNDPAGPAERPAERYYAAPEWSSRTAVEPLPKLAPLVPPKTKLSWTEISFSALSGIWILVAAGVLIRGLLANIRFAYRLRSCRELVAPGLIDVLRHECQSLRVRHLPKVKEVADLNAPAVFGLVRSTICLPANLLQSLTIQELRWIFRHELAHVRRRDAWLLSFASVVQSLHWFNPLMWFTTSRLRLYIEAAADDLATACCPAHEAVAYGRLLLKFAEQTCSPNPPLVLSFLPFGSVPRLRDRIDSLTRSRRLRQNWVGWVIAAMTIPLTIIGLTDASERSENRGAQTNLPQVDLSVARLIGTDEGPRSLHNYDVVEVLARLRMSEPGSDAEKMLLALVQGTISSESARIRDAILTVEVTDDQHQALTRMLQAWRIGGAQQIAVELRIIQADLEHASAIEWIESVVRLEQQGGRPVLAARTTEKQFRQFIQSVQTDRRSNMRFAPQITLFNGQAATIQELAKRPFVTAVEPQEDGSLRPVIEVLEDGLKVQLQAVTAGDGKIDLTFDLQVSEIHEVAMANLPIGHANDVDTYATVQVPSVSKMRIQSTVNLSNDESVIVAAPQLFDGKSAEKATSALYYAITPRLMDVTPAVARSVVPHEVRPVRR